VPGWLLGCCCWGALVVAVWLAGLLLPTQSDAFLTLPPGTGLQAGYGGGGGYQQQYAHPVAPQQYQQQNQQPDISSAFQEQPPPPYG
jgi:hypothetical protein